MSIFVRAFCCSNSLAIIKGLFAKLKMSPLRVKGSFTHLSGELSPTATHDRYANNIFRCDYGTLSQTGSTLTLSHFTRCTLGLNRHFYLNILCDHCLHDSGLYIQKILTNKEMANFQKLDFLRVLTTNPVITGARKLNGTSVKSLAIHNSKREMRDI